MLLTTDEAFEWIRLFSLIFAHAFEPGSMALTLLKVWLLNSNGELQRCNVAGHISALIGSGENTHRLVASSSWQIWSSDRIKSHTIHFSPDDTQLIVASSCSGNQNPLSTRLLLYFFFKKRS